MDHAAILQQAARALAGGNRAEVLRCCRMLPAGEPGHAQAQRLIALLAYQDDDFTAAAAHARAALAGGDGMAHQVMAAALMKLDRPDQAVPHFRAALAVAGDTARAEYNLAMALLAAGDWTEGWSRFEARWRVKRLPPWAQPWEWQWDGSPPVGLRVLAHAEQGFGDTLQFVRYLPLLAATGARVTLAAPPQLERLLAAMPEIAVVTNKRQIPAWDVHVPLMSLPRLFSTTPASVPAPVPYLPAPPPAVLPGEGLRIGLVWAGNRRDPEDRRRSLPVPVLADLLARLPQGSIISLQHEDEAMLDAVPGGRDVIRLGSGFRDFADTAAAVMALDLVIAVDTAAAHLAGALGRPVWLLLATGADWRWLAKGETTPWYPTMRLFRQARPGDWGPVIDGVAAAAARL